MAKTTKKQPKIEEENNTKSSANLGRFRLKCKNTKQKELAKLITDKEIVIASGPAGVGKSYVAIARGIELLFNKSNAYSKLVISTPAVEAEEKHGFLPGDLMEKMAPYVASSLDIVDKILGTQARIKLVEDGVIIIEAIAYIRGKSIDNSILIMEEVQNMSPKQVKTLLTRIGSNSKFILSGDLDQSDRFKDVKESGLYDAVNRHKNIEEIGFVEFGIEDIVRNPIICKILKNYKVEDNCKIDLLNEKEYKNLDSNKKEIKSSPSKELNIMDKIKNTFK